MPNGQPTVEDLEAQTRLKQWAREAVDLSSISSRGRANLLAGVLPK